MDVVIAVLFTLLVCGVLLAALGGTNTNFGWEPNLFGCAFVFVIGLCLLVIAAMYAGKYFL